MELKFSDSIAYPSTLETPIAPLWNGNNYWTDDKRYWGWTPIAPLWNGNQTYKQALLALIALQSHLYGIEINKVNRESVIDKLLQSHLYGIEILKTAQSFEQRKDSNRTFMELKLNL